MLYGKHTIGSLLQEQFRGRVTREEPLAAHSSAQAGGPADFFLELESTEEVERLVRLCCQFRVPLLVIGNGSNILFTDQGIRGIVACLRTKGYRLEGRYEKRTKGSLFPFAQKNACILFLSSKPPLH